MKWRYAVFVVIGLAGTLTAADDIKYDYKAMLNGRLKYRLNMVVRKIATDDVSVYTHIEGPNRLEDIVVIVGADQRVKSVMQTTKTDAQAFRWEVQVRDTASVARWEEASGALRRQVFTFPTNGYPIQAFFYLLQQPKFRDSSLDIQLLIPMNRFIPLSIHRSGEEIITVDGRDFQSIRVEARLSGLLGWIGPKYMFWIEKKTGTLLRYLDGDAVVDIDLSRSKGLL
ncbi:hypothetical protein EBR57_01145 [bacterium]|nr:hypothetical protein [bacterium]